MLRGDFMEATTGTNALENIAHLEILIEGEG